MKGCVWTDTESSSVDFCKLQRRPELPGRQRVSLFARQVEILLGFKKNLKFFDNYITKDNLTAYVLQNFE